MKDRVFYDPESFEAMRSPGGWYFWATNGKYFYGPFATEAEARGKMRNYDEA